MAGLGEWLFGKEASTKKRSFQTGGQQNLMNSLLGGLGGKGGGANQALQFLQQYLNPNQQQGFEQFSQPYMQQFQSKILPGIAERFAGGAQGGALSSSGFGQALGGAGADLQSMLAQLYSGQQQNAATGILGLGQNLLGQQTFGYEQQQANPGFIPQAILASMQGFSKGMSGGMMG